MPDAPGIAYKAYEIEEFIDIFFFRRLGILVARAARSLGLTPNTVSVIAGIVGTAGGLFLLDDSWVPLGVTLIVAHGVFDSADGQLARLTGQTSEWGRVLDGLAGYATHIAAYLAIAVRLVRGGAPLEWVTPLVILAGICTAIHAQLYDYHRTVYASIVLKGQPTVVTPRAQSTPGLLGLYEELQRWFSGRHSDVEQVIAADAAGGAVTRQDRDAYRRAFRSLMPAWNLLGDNVRRYGFIVLAVMHRLDWYFAFILVPLNVTLMVVWLLQWRADTRYLAQRLTETTSALSSAGR